MKVSHPLIVEPHQPSPRGGTSEIPIHHPPHHIEVGFDTTLPALAPGNAVVCDSERGKQHKEIVREVLAPTHRTSEDCPTVFSRIVMAYT